MTVDEFRMAMADAKYIPAGSELHLVPPRTVVAGVPAKVIKQI